MESSSSLDMVRGEVSGTCLTFKIV
jgi:hypothetical protein